VYGNGLFKNLPSDILSVTVVELVGTTEIQGKLVKIFLQVLFMIMTFYKVKIFNLLFGTKMDYLNIYLVICC